jgi:hypothetical protein
MGDWHTALSTIGLALIAVAIFWLAHVTKVGLRSKRNGNNAAGKK